MHSDMQEQKRRISANNASLKLIKYQSYSSFEDFEGQSKDMAILSKILKMKNKKFQCKTNRFEYANRLSLQSKILKERDNAIMKLKQEKTAEVKRFKLQTQNLKLQKDEIQKQRKGKKLMKDRQLIEKLTEYSGDSQEIRKEMEFYMKHMQLENWQDDFQLSFEEEEEKEDKTEYKLQNIHKYTDLLKLMIESNKQSMQNSQYVLDMLNKKHQLTSHFQNRYIIKIMEMINKCLSYSRYNFNEKVIDQPSKIQEAINMFAYDADKQKKYKHQLFNEAQFWEKVCYLFSKGQTQYYLIQCHFRQYNQTELLEHFKASTKDIQSNYTPDIDLFKNNPHYRQFILLLEGRYLSYCLQNKPQGFTHDQMIYYALRQITLLQKKQKPYEFQIAFIKQQCKQLQKQLERSLSIQVNLSNINIKIQKMFFLGQFNRVFKLLSKFKRITDMEYLIMIAALAQLNINHSTTLFYNHQDTFDQLIILLEGFLTTSDSHNHHYGDYYILLHAFLPITTKPLKKKEKDELIFKFITFNKHLFMHIIQYKGFYKVFKDLELKCQDIPSIITLLISKHKLYSYALQLGISSCINLKQLKFYDSIDQQSKRKSLQHVRENQIVNDNSTNSLSHDYLSILGEFPPLQLNTHKEELIKIMFFSLNLLVETNIDLLRNIQKRKHCYEQICYTNELFKKLKNKEMRDKIWSDLSIRGQSYDKKLVNVVNAIIFTSDMNRLQNHIFNRQYKQMVDILNDFYLNISDNVAQIKPLVHQIWKNQYELDHIFITFAADIIESIQNLKENKPFVIKKNQTILKKLCQSTHIFLKQFCNSNLDGSKQLLHELQKLNNSLSYV